MNTVLKRMMITLLGVVLIISMSGCNKKESEVEETTKTVTAELSQEDIDALMQQAADREVTKDYEKYMPDQAFANAEIFGIDREGDTGTAYVYMNYSEYVTLRGKAYEMSGGNGEAIIRFNYTEKEPVLNEVEWSADGGDHDNWMSENFPEEYLRKDKAYKAYDGNGRSVLAIQLGERVEKTLGVPIEYDNLLNIDVEKGTYEIVKVIETGEGENYKFDTEILEQGNLSDL